MADTAVAVTQMAVNVPTVNLYAGADGGAGTGMVSVSSGATAVIACKGDTKGLVIMISGDGTHDATATIETGNEPPSELSGKAVPTLMSGAVIDSDEFYIWPVDGGQFIKSDLGDLEILIGGTGPVYVGAFRLPRAQ